jgi:uncharacterized protein (TIGR03437 family)
LVARSSSSTQSSDLSPASIGTELVRGLDNEPTPANFKIAFFGDQGLGSGSVAVLNLIRNEGAQALVLLGDFDYHDNPSSWENQLNGALGVNFPVLGIIGNHDVSRWGGSTGYQQRLKDRMARTGISWIGDLGVQSTVRYKGITFIQVAPGVTGSGHEAYLRDQLNASDTIWNVASWHKCMRKMQVGGKPDETGWGVYEEARKGGAIIATAHEHSYSRTHLLSDVQNQMVANASNTLNIAFGRSFGFVSGLGGHSIRDQQLSGPWWASIYTSNQSANHGALFATFNLNGVANKASFYFKDISGRIPDRFDVISDRAPASLSSVSAASFAGSQLAAEQIVSGFGANLAITTSSATTSPMPTSLAGTTVSVKDSLGVERMAPLFLVSPTQVNYQMPPGTAAGAARVTIISGDGSRAAGTVQISGIAPGLFAANENGRGIAAASALRIKADGSRSFERVVRYDAAQNKFVSVPIDLGAGSDQVVLLLFGTGIRYRSSLSAVSVNIGGVNAPVLFAGAQGQFTGLDQLNVALPRSLIGRGDVELTLTVDGRVANTLHVNIR